MQIRNFKVDSILNKNTIWNLNSEIIYRTSFGGFLAQNTGLVHIRLSWWISCKLVLWLVSKFIGFF